MPEADSARAPAMATAALSSEMTQPDLTWIILETAPRLTEDGKIIKPRTDMLLEDEHPPLPSTVTLHKRVCAGDKASASIVAVHPSGRFLVRADSGVEVEYFLCHAGTGLATRLPSSADVDNSRVYLRTSTRLSKRVDSEVGDSRAHPRRGTGIGLMANQRRPGDYLVAELFAPAGTTHHQALICYSTEDSAWVVKQFASSQHHPPWESNGGVLAHDGNLWWVDTKHGVLACDPSVDSPDLRYSPLPEPADESTDDYYQHRCVRISEGKLCCAEVRDVSGEQKVVMWTLVSDPESPSVWTMDWEQNLSEQEGYKGLPSGKLPEVAFIDPQRCHVVYLFYGMRLVAIDTTPGQKAVLSITDYTSKSIIPWELHRELLRFKPDAPALKEPSTCLFCDGIISVNCACDTCLGRILLLLNKMKTTTANIDSVCLRCGSTLGCKRNECAGFALPVSIIEGEWFGWVTGKEKWALLFKGVQVNQACPVGMPIRLNPRAGNRCKLCNDYMGANANTLYRTSDYCSLECCQREPSLQRWATVLVSLKFTGSLGSPDSFCTTCAGCFSKADDLSKHEKHTFVSVVLQDRRPCIELPHDHELTRSLTNITPLLHEDADVSSSVLLPLHPRGARRCTRCRSCLVEGGGRTCSLGCALSAPALQPRPIQLRSRAVSG